LTYLRHLAKHDESPKVRRLAKVCREQLAGPDGICQLYLRILINFSELDFVHRLSLSC
jgi:hypothetical protein